jgi:membrane associated rhomboid family serine protease
MLGYWALIQLLSGLGSLSEIDKGGVAFFAHVGGFIAGLVLVRLFASEEVLRRRPTQPESYYRYRTFG